MRRFRRVSEPRASVPGHLPRRRVAGSLPLAGFTRDRPRRARLGSTLVDVLVAVAMVGTAVVAAAAAVLGASAHQQANARIRAVTPVLSSLLDEVRAADYATLDARFAEPRDVSGIPGVQDARATFRVEPVETGSSRWTARRVIVTLSWTGGTGPATASAATIVAERATFAESLASEASATSPGGTATEPPATEQSGADAGSDPVSGDTTDSTSSDAGIFDGPAETTVEPGKSRKK